ncbi:hypothetical protein HPP92_026603 [Vanilla planifolia]|uniref:S-protein homolog n=1 Tax=Vanilla planifolia TaxID=51239 RepID=A0A835U6V2_VANPL|nr:hypothetical protein HPP92_026821 [Vanilla planifolia]KAG0450728.1 hypothetical protein HPP92_026603 [Vanilla planifolia]
MACVAFNLFLFQPAFLPRINAMEKDVQLVHLQVDKLPNQACSIPASKPPGDMKLHCLNRVMSLQHKHSFSSFSGLLKFGSGMHNFVLCGYWIGPDVEDGWGFVEAFVDRNYICNKAFLCFGEGNPHLMKEF